MIRFILNNELIETSESSGSTLLDFVRYKKNLKGTKIGCREGDCGACTLLMGEWAGKEMEYKSLTSCITPLGNAANKHIVSIEGLNAPDLNPFQQAMVDESGQQCGFCTVGFIVSFAGECLSKHPISYDSIVSSLDGNICRCTGYKSIERAAKIVHEQLKERDQEQLLEWLVDNKFIPDYFLGIPERLIRLNNEMRAEGKVIVGGGTDLLVQKHDEIYESEVHLISDNKELQGIWQEDGNICIGAATNTTSVLHSKIMLQHFPRLWEHLKLVSSTPIRNIATIAGNFINASPIGDLTAFFIALDTSIELRNPNSENRIIKLKDLYLAYKTLDMYHGEFVSKLFFKIPSNDSRFNFEKVSKRRYLDIATVNSAIQIKIVDEIVEEVHLSAGGVGPTPLFLDKTCDFLKGMEMNELTLIKANEIIQTEISPISDARGTAEYKRLLMRQLFFAHFIELFPQQIELKTLT